MRNNEARNLMLGEFEIHKAETVEVQRELSLREGVTTHVVGPQAQARLMMDGAEIVARGPCTITINND
ncbi:MAG: BC1881 family protein [Parvibaculaceae bacterium]